MDKDNGSRMTIRPYLSGKGIRKEIDMEEVYRMIDSGKTVAQTAAEFGVNPSTLRRKHKKYQLWIREMMEEKEAAMPPLPEDM